MKPRISRFVLASSIVLSLAAPIATAGIIWDGGGAANTNINTAANWDGDAVNALNGTTAAEFGTGGSTATINTNASFTGITFNRDANFAIANGNGSLTVGSAGITVNLPTTTTRTHTISESNLILGAGQTWTLNNNTGTARLDVSSVIDDGASSFSITRAGTGLLVLSGNNTFNGNVSFAANMGIIRVTHSGGLGVGPKTASATVGSGARYELDGTGGNLSFASNIQFSLSGSILRNTAGNNVINGITGAALGAGNGIVEVTGGTLTLAGSVRAVNSGNRTLDIRGGSHGFITGQITNGASIFSLLKSGTGTWRITNATNNHTGTTTVNQGTLIVTSGSGLGVGTNVPVTNPSGGNVAVAANANLSYAAAADVPLAIGGNLTITGGTGGASTTIGCAIGSTATSASINVTGDAIISDAPHTIDLYPVPGTTPVTDNYTLISGTGAGSSLNPATAPTLKVYNNTNFSVGGFTRGSGALQVAITAATPLADAYWVGGLAGSTNVWAVSNGTTGNWAATAGGTPQALVPGGVTNVIISATSPAVAPTATVLGADMTINSLRISDTVNSFGLTDDGYTLKLLSDGLTMDSGVPASSIAAKVALDGDQTWTIDSANPLTVSGVISGPSALTKAGSGTLALSGANTLAGNVQVAAGTLSLANVNALASSTLLCDAADTGVLSYDVVGATTYNLGALSGDGALDAGGKTFSIGANNSSTEFSGSLSNGALTKVGSGTLTLSGSNTFSGNITLSSGKLRIAHTNALNAGGFRWIFANANAPLELDGTAGDIVLGVNNGIQTSGSVINNIAGNNSILGGVFRTTGAGDTTITSSDGSLTLAGSITSNSVRKLTLTGSSTGANTVSGAIQDGGNSTANPNPLTKDGTGTWTLSGINTYSGDTNVNNGTLVLAIGGSQAFYPKTDGTSNKITGTGGGTLTLDGALSIDLTNANSASSWLLVDVANLAETYGTNFTVTGFTETPASSGVWKKTVGTDEYTFTEADGLLTRAAAANTFATWLAANPPATGFTTDSDNDGVPNGVENVLGTNPNVYSAGLTEVSATTNSATFKHTLNPTVASDVSHTYEWSTDLTEWKLSGQTNTGGVSASITDSAPVSGVVTVVTTLTSGTSPRIFTRIKATMP